MFRINVNHAKEKDKTMTTREKDQTELDAFHDNRAALYGATAYTPPEGGYVVSEMVAALTICRNYLNEEVREIRDEVSIVGGRTISEEDYEFYKNWESRIHAVLEPVCAALGGANAHSPPEGGYVVSEISAALKICRNYLNEQSRETSQWQSARIDAVLKPVCCALDLERAGAAPERETGLAAAGKKDKTMTTRAKDQTELDGATAETPPEGGSGVVSKRAARFVDDVRESGRAALERADAGPERGTGLAADADEQIRHILNDPAASPWLRDALGMALERRDPVKAALDADTIRAVLERADADQQIQYIVYKDPAASPWLRMFLRFAGVEGPAETANDAKILGAILNARADAVLKPVLDTGGSELVSEISETLTTCLDYLNERSRQKWTEAHRTTCKQDYECYADSADIFDSIVEPIRAVGGAIAETPPEVGSAVVPEMAAALKTCLGYLDVCEGGEHHAQCAERIDAVLKPVHAALYMAGPGRERETGPAATGEKARGRSMDGGMAL